MKILKKYKFAFVLLTILLLVSAILYKENYHKCVKVDLIMCLRSKKYTSPTGKFAFRYPHDYPLSFRTGEEMETQYNHKNYVEWINFSNEFYPNAGGDRLGDIIVKNNFEFQNVNEYGEKVLNDYQALPDSYKSKPPIVEYTKIDDKDAVKINSGNQISTFGNPGDKFIIINDNNLYEIHFNYDSYYHKLPLEYYSNGEKIILSTFVLN